MWRWCQHMVARMNPLLPVLVVLATIAIPPAKVAALAAVKCQACEDLLTHLKARMDETAKSNFGALPAPFPASSTLRMGVLCLDLIRPSVRLNCMGRRREQRLGGTRPGIVAAKVGKR
jgi:hypothetical protein